MRRAEMSGWKHRWLLVAVALISASSFALSVQGRHWWWIGDPKIGELTIGPLGVHSSSRGVGALSWAGSDARWERFGTATWTAGMIAMFVLIVVAGALAAKRIPRLAARTALVAIATALVVGTGFAMTRPTALPFALDYGVALFGLAVVAGVLAAVGVLRAPSA